MSVKFMTFNNMIEGRSATFRQFGPLTAPKRSAKPQPGLCETQFQPTVSINHIHISVKKHDFQSN